MIQTRYTVTQKGEPGERWIATDGVTLLIVDPQDSSESARISTRRFQHQELRPVSAIGANGKTTAVEVLSRPMGEQSIIFGELDGVRCYVLDGMIILTRKTINLDAPQG